MTDPLVTVVMPIRNERDTIRASIDAVLRQQLAGPLEVVVADGMSDDGTRAVLDELGRADARLRVVDNPARGTGAALNAALAAARGAYWVRIDGHSEIPPDYVTRLVEHLRAGRAEAAGGVVRGSGRTPFGRAVAAAHDSRFGIGDSHHHHAVDVGFIDHVTHGAYRLDLTRRIGGFDEGLVRNQDYDFDRRFREAGGRILIDPSVTFQRGVRETPAALARQFYEYGYWKQVVLRRHPGSLHVRWLVPPALVATLGVCTALAWTRPGRLGLAVATTAYGAVVAGGAGTLGRRIGPARIPHAALALATMHLAWGAGFLRSGLAGAR